MSTRRSPTSRPSRLSLYFFSLRPTLFLAVANIGLQPSGSPHVRNPCDPRVEHILEMLAWDRHSHPRDDTRPLQNRPGQSRPQPHAERHRTAGPSVWDNRATQILRRVVAVGASVHGFAYAFLI